MTADQVIRLQEAAPFQAYTILLADGRSFEIDHPDFLTVAPEDELIWVYDGIGNVEIVDLLLVVSLRYGARSPAA